MAEELNPQDSSQPAPDASVSAGPNAVGKPSEPVANSNMTPSQSSDYYNKTQQLAQDRRQFEAEKKAWEQERTQYQQPQGQAQNGYFQNPVPANPSGYPSGQQAFQANPSVPPIDPQEYANLVEQFGKEGADAQVRFLQKYTAPAQQLISVALQKAHEIDIKTVTQELNARGAQIYGDQWKEKGSAVIDLIGRTGIPMEQAWYAINGASIEQAARDKAYQSQEIKESANVGQSSVQPASTHAGKFNDFDSAFDSAWSQVQR